MSPNFAADVRFSLSLPTDLLRAEGVNLAQYFGLWAVAEEPFMQMLQHLQSMDLASHVQASDFDGDVDAQRAAAEVIRAQDEDTADGGSAEEGRAQVAILSIKGLMTKYGSSLSTAGSTVRLRRELRRAARSSDVHAILVHLDTPGGTVAGTADLAAEVAAAAEEKPVFAFVEDLTASAGYWVASQADRVYVNDPTALVGSIGTYLALYDMSALAGMEGIKPVVIRAGEFKGAGFPGTEITEEQKANWQEMIDKTQAEFTAGVSRGRSLDASDVPVTGKVYMANDAVAFGLADGIQSIDETIEELAEAAMARRSADSISMSSSMTDTITVTEETMPKEKQNDETQERADNQPEAAAEEPSSSQAEAESEAAAADVSGDSDIASMQAEIQKLRAEQKADKQRIAELEGAKQKAEFEAFADEHRKQILPANAERCTRTMEALAAYDAMLATGEESSALEAFKAMIAALPEQFSTKVDVTGGDGEASGEEPSVSVPAGTVVDPVRASAAAKVKKYADEHGLSFAEALAQLGNDALLED